MNSLLKYGALLSYFITSLSFGQATEDDFAQSLQALHQQWGIVNYTLSGDAQEKAFKQLADHSYQQCDQQQPPNLASKSPRAIVRLKGMNVAIDLRTDAIGCRSQP